MLKRTLISRRILTFSFAITIKSTFNVKCNGVDICLECLTCSDKGRRLELRQGHSCLHPVYNYFILVLFYFWGKKFTL